MLILAGSRAGKADLLAREHNVAHKCLIPIGGKSIIARVLETIERTLPGSPIILSADDFAAVATDESVARLHSEGRLTHAQAQGDIASSVIEASRSAEFPLLITTADNPLLTAEAIERLIAEGEKTDAEAIIVVTRREAIEAAHPGGKNRYYRLRDGEFSNCNLFWIGNRAALAAAQPFAKGGQFLKVKGRLLQTFGLLNFLRYRTRLWTVEQLLRSVSRRLKVRIRPLVLDDGRLAIDVDDERSLQMVEELLA